jgi:hypothetical protein
MVFAETALKITHSPIKLYPSSSITQLEALRDIIGRERWASDQASTRQVNLRVCEPQLSRNIEPLFMLFSKDLSINNLCTSLEWAADHKDG